MRIPRKYVLLSSCLLVIGSVASVSMMFFLNPVPAQPSSTELPNRPEGGECLVFAEPEIDLGLIKETTHHDFIYQNRSSKVARIKNLQGSCGRCTFAKVDKEVVQPGETGRIHVTLQPSPDRIGRRSYVIDVEYEAGETRSARLLVVAQYRPDVITSDQVTLRSVSGKGGKADISLVDYRDEPLKVREITTSSPDLHVRVAEEPTSYFPGWRYRFEVAHEGTRAPGDYAETVVIRTSDPEREILSIRVDIHQIRRVRVAPETFLLTTSADGAEATGTIYLDDTVGEKVEVASVSSTHTGLHWHLKEAGPSQQAVEVRLSQKDIPEGKLPISVRIVLKKPTEEEICVTVIP